MSGPSPKSLARLEAMPGVGQAGLAALRKQKVAVLGVGNVGGQLAQHVVLLGVPVVLVDRDVVEDVNLGTQGFAEDQLEQFKVDARAARLAPLNRSCRIEPLHADIRHVGLGTLRDTSLLFSCLDSRPARIIVNEIATRLGIPWIDGALDGSGRSLIGRVACYDPRVESSACYLCPHDSRSLGDLWNDSERVDSCAVRWTDADRASPPTLATSALGGVVASMQAIWGLNLLLGRSGVVAGREIHFDLDRHVLSSHRLVRNPRCVFDHKVWHLTPLSESRQSATVEDAFTTAERALGQDVVLELVRRGVVTKTRCCRCGAERQANRIAEALDADVTLCRCGGEMRAVAIEALHRFSRAEARAFLGRTWAELGLPAADVVVATAGEREMHLVVND